MFQPILTEKNLHELMFSKNSLRRVHSRSKDLLVDCKSPNTPQLSIKQIGQEEIPTNTNQLLFLN